MMHSTEYQIMKFFSAMLYQNKVPKNKTEWIQVKKMRS